MDLLCWLPEIYMIFGVLVLLMYSVQYNAHDFYEKCFSGFKTNDFKYQQIKKSNTWERVEESEEKTERSSAFQSIVSPINDTVCFSNNIDSYVIKAGPSNILTHVNNYIIIWFISVAFILYNNPLNNALLFSGVFLRTQLANGLEIILFIISALILYMGRNTIQKIAHVEFLILICLCVIGQNLLLISVDLISLYVCLELQTFCLVVLCSINYKSIFNVEAGIKYFLLSAFSSALLLAGTSLIYWSTGLTNLTALNTLLPYYQSTFLVIGVWLVSLSLLWKLSAAPLHMWAADVYQGANSIVSLFISTSPKLAVLGFWINIWSTAVHTTSMHEILIFFSALSLLIGALAALGQVNIKRLMAYSSIAHMGFLLMPLCQMSGSSSALITHLIIYILTSIVAWGLIMWSFKRQGSHVESTPQYLWDYTFLSKTHPLATFTWAIVMMSLAGLPPIAGFLGKLYIFLWSLSSHQYTLVAIAIISSLISSVYYLRLIRIMYIDNKSSYSIFQLMDASTSYLISICIFLLLLLLFYSSPLVLLSHLLII
jgi:NADH-quinone oxidoreductase subunit N